MEISFNQAASLYDLASKMHTKALSGEEVAVNPPPSDPMKPDFFALIGQALNKAIDTGYKAENVSTKALAGQSSLNDLVTAISSAELTLNTVVTIRDRVISAYQDIIRMPI